MKKEYKLRAECINDVVVLLANNKEFVEINTEFKEFGEVELEFSTKLNLNEIIEKISKQIDSHVMYQTVQETANYIGERNYSINF